MHILAINGAPRPDGHTSDLLSLFCLGAEAAGARPDSVRLAEFDIRPCLGCFCCWRSSDSEPHCAIEDDMPKLIARLSDADALIFATPLYFHSLSSHLKIFIERLLPLLEPAPLEGRLGFWKNRLRNRSKIPRRAALIAAAGYRDKSAAAGLIPTFNLIADSLEAEPAGILIRPESFFLDFSLGSPRMRRKIAAVLEAVKTAGAEFAALGRIRDETLAAASAPLTEDQAQFNHHFSAYWQIAREAGESGPVRKAVKKAAREDLRFIMPDLADCYDSEAGGGFRAIIAFDFSGRQPGRWHFAVSGGRCRAYACGHEAPDVTVKTSSEIFIALLTDRRDPRRLIASGKLVTTGDAELFTRFFDLLKRPKP